MPGDDLEEIESAGETRPPNTRSINASFSSGRTRTESKTALSLGKRPTTSAIRASNSSITAAVWPVRWVAASRPLA